MDLQVRRKIFNQSRLRENTLLTAQHESDECRYVTFHYTGKESQKTANKFKKFNVKVAFKTNNNLSSILCPKIENHYMYNKSGVYKISCDDCDNYYIGQTVNFNKRFKNHMSAWKNNKPERSNVAKHLLDNKHKLKCIENNLSILQLCNKGNTMNAWEELFIYREKCKDRNKLINEHVNFDSSNLYRRVGHYIRGGASHAPSLHVKA